MTNNNRDVWFLLNVSRQHSNFRLSISTKDAVGTIKFLYKYFVWDIVIIVIVKRIHLSFFFSNDKDYFETYIELCRKKIFFSVQLKSEVGNNDKMFIFDV